jgi:hypothetical protein
VDEGSDEEDAPPPTDFMYEGGPRWQEEEQWLEELDELELGNDARLAKTAKLRLKKHERFKAKYNTEQMKREMKREIKAATTPVAAGKKSKGRGKAQSTEEWVLGQHPALKVSYSTFSVKYQFNNI